MEFKRNLSRIFVLIGCPSRLCLAFLHKTSRLWPDKLFLKIKYRLVMGKKLNLKNPKTFSEKLQWLKLYNRKPEYTIMVDKLAVKEFVASKISKKYIIPTLGVWNTPDEIEWAKLPKQFVLKTTHGGGGSGVVICKDKSLLDIDIAKKRLNNSLKSDIYLNYREWPYKDVPKRIIAEKFITPIKENAQIGLPDYKFYCFNGEPKLVLVATGRFEDDVRFDYFDMDWNKLPLVWDNPNSELEIPEPVCFEEMKDICRKLTENIPHVRCDLYVLEDIIYFGELTFFDASGFCKFENEEWNLKLGNLIKLPVFN